MSENPYQAPVPPPKAGTGGLDANGTPRTLKTICILCIILGALGFFMSVLGVGSLLFQEQLTAFQMTMAHPEQQEMQAKMAEAQASFFIPNMLLVLCNLVIGPMLLIGGISVLSRKIWGPKILSFALISAAIFILVRMLIYSFLQVQAFSIMKEMMTGQIQGGPEAGTMETIMVASMYFGVAVSVAIALAFAAFYFWSWRYLKKDACQQYLSTFSA